MLHVTNIFDFWLSSSSAVSNVIGSPSSSSNSTIPLHSLQYSDPVINLSYDIPPITAETTGASQSLTNQGLPTPVSPPHHPHSYDLDSTPSTTAINHHVEPTPHPMVTRSKLGIVKPNHKYALTVTSSISIPREPKNVKAALSHLGWTTAMIDELIALHQNDTWKLVPRTP